jgi:hypothetical protein
MYLISDLPDDPEWLKHLAIIYRPRIKIDDYIIPEKIGRIEKNLPNTILVKLLASDDVISLDKSLYAVDFFTQTHYEWFVDACFQIGPKDAYSAVVERDRDLKEFAKLVLKKEFPNIWLTVKNK